MIQLSELYAKSNGWTTQRHKNYPTTDIPVYKLSCKKKSEMYPFQIVKATDVPVYKLQEEERNL